MGYKAISDYGIIGNMLSAALVGTDGSIDWCCLPRFDSPSVFAAILDDEKGGRFRVSPQTSFESHQAYLSDTNVLQTTFETDSGRATVTDFMPSYLTPGRRLAQFKEIHRMVKCTAGHVALEVLFEPKMDYARGRTCLSSSEYGVAAKQGTERLALSSAVPFTLYGDEAVARFTLQEGQKADFVLSYGSEQPRPVTGHRSAARLRSTASYWQQQADGCTFHGPWRPAVVRSYLALHLLVYWPTRAIVAAPTTSLPERIGGERNWDYRFAWLRDASLILNAFSYLGHREEATGFMRWLFRNCGECGPKAQILYNVSFGNPQDEEELDHLEGHRQSRPVRIGNSAYRQFQLDVFGEVLEAAYNHLMAGGRIAPSNWHLLETFVNAAAETWHLPDNGIWEVRSGPFHFVHSKVMCWVALDRGIKTAERLGHKKNLARWRAAAQQIQSDVLSRGWKSEQRAFTQHYDTQALDASNLLIPLYGFLPMSDGRITSTIERTVEDLSWNGLLRRYRTEETDDGLSGAEGAFLWCSFWLVRNLVRLGRLEEAAERYERLLGYGNHLDLFSEMVDPVSGGALGNFPQGLTHLAVIISGVELTRAQETRRAEAGGSLASPEARNRARASTGASRGGQAPLGPRQRRFHCDITRPG